MSSVASKPKIRTIQLVKPDDAWLIGSTIFAVDEVVSFGWNDRFSCVAVKVKCHPDLIATDVTDKADWMAFVGTF